MTDKSKTRIEKIEELELNKETVQDLSEQQSEEAQGGVLSAVLTLVCPGPSQACISRLCSDHCSGPVNCVSP